MVSLIKHIYNEQDDNDMTQHYKEERFHFLAQLFSTADKYDVPSLRILAVEKVKSLLPDMKFQDLTTNPYPYLVSRMESMRTETYTRAIQVIYNHVGDRRLQLATTEYLQTQVSNINRYADFKAVVGACGELAVELLKGLNATHKDPNLTSLLKKEPFVQVIRADPALGRDLICQTLERSAKGLFICNGCRGHSISPDPCPSCRNGYRATPATKSRVGYYVPENTANQ